MWAFHKKRSESLIEGDVIKVETDEKVTNVKPAFTDLRELGSNGLLSQDAWID